MILDKENRVLIAHRRLFENEHIRFFIGVVDGYEDGIVKATGYTFIRDTFSGEIIRKEEFRTKIVSIHSGSFFVYELPLDMDIRDLKFKIDSKGGPILTDGKKFSMDLTEHHRVTD